jgi:hypothetical protein
MAQASSGSCFPLPVGFVLARARSQETTPAFRQEPGIMNSRSSGRRPQMVRPPGPARTRSDLGQGAAAAGSSRPQWGRASDGGPGTSR